MNALKCFDSVEQLVFALTSANKPLADGGFEFEILIELLENELSTNANYTSELSGVFVRSLYVQTRGFFIGRLRGRSRSF